MKKTLQKELKFQALPNEVESTGSSKRTQSTTSQKITANDDSKNGTIKSEASYAIIQTTPTATLPNTPSKVKASKQLHSTEEINFKYLKHVVLKFVTSREYEVRNFFYSYLHLNKNHVRNESIFYDYSINMQIP